MSKPHAENIRLFIALPLPIQIKDQLKRWVQQNKGSLPFRKWTHPDDYHITLQFLGELPADKLEDLNIALADIHYPTFELHLAEVGTFGPPVAPRVLWAAVDGDLSQLTALHGEVVKKTSPLGFVPEERSYKPHITLARTFAGEGSLDVTAFSSFRSSERWLVDHFVLMRTHLNTSPMYEVIGKYPLQLR
ncbi:RNA 2',3'-cyclic phosphodiesterase [Paenibacillus sp. YIM B09110]|uniref:RNA 2',3'-cyclic phosphodiesterase n=1 Tax=Paenibacillus sp. YIM B09110 TaxID=3126102 RepID=UPI00301BF6AC